MSHRFNQTTAQELPNETREGDCLKYMYFLRERCTGNNHVFSEDGFHKVEIHGFVESNEKVGS